VLERRYDGAWHKAATATLSSKSRYSFAVKLPSKSTFTYRVRRPADSKQAGAASATVKILGIDRTLKSGVSGPDVTALQKRLRALHYDVGSVTGTYNFDTVHAVVAFQKVQGIARDGVVGPKAWAKLANPRVPHLRHPLRGVAAVEVDLTRQVLYYAVDGVIQRILDSSTGGGYTYTGSDGTQQRAITPTGHFSVKYKVNDWERSKLGVLYRPAYFNYSGYAIHGEPEVPSYPASHGCVRITVPAMDRLYSKLTPSLSVWIYRS
jgi:lipoprotein-anchoring transpeptidase ErfK/SrfK